MTFNDHPFLQVDSGLHHWSSPLSIQKPYTNSTLNKDNFKIGIKNHTENGMKFKLKSFLEGANLTVHK